MTQRRRTDPYIVGRITELSSAGYTGPRIERLLSADPDWADELPSLRTIQDIARKAEPTTEWWNMAEADLDEARAVLPVLLWRVNWLRRHEPGYGNQALRIAKGLAKWIAKVRGIAPSLAPNEAYKLALRYWMKPTPDLDEELARALEGRGQLADIDGSDGVPQVGVVDRRPG
jgi:hypothetical protein